MGQEQEMRSSSALERVSTYGTYLFSTGWILVGLTFLTNRTPLPYYPWATLPVTLPISQPHIGPYPASFTIGAWMTDIMLPFVILQVWHRWRPQSRLKRNLVLVGGVGFSLFTCQAYCRFIWPQPEPPYLFEPDVAVICWRFCTTYVNEWSIATFGVALLAIPAIYLVGRRPRAGLPLLITFGVLSFPLGAPALYDAYLLYREAWPPLEPAVLSRSSPG